MTEPTIGDAGRPCVFLDRDGVVNAMVYHSDFGLVDSPANAAEVRLLPGVAAAIDRLRGAGFLVVIVSNQPGAAKGKVSASQLEAVDAEVHRQLAAHGTAVDAVYLCLHHPGGVLAELATDCGCRKPRPGLLLRAAADHGVAPDRSFMVGDGITDVAAGKAAGVRTVLLGAWKPYIAAAALDEGGWPDIVVADLPAAVDWILNMRATKGEPVESDTFIQRYLAQASVILAELSTEDIARVVNLVVALKRRRGRLFILGSGGGAAHAGHAVNDFRKLAGIEAYSPSDNVAELTARVNDDGWAAAYAGWLRASRIGPEDMVMVISVGGGDVALNLSPNLVRALELAKEVGATTCGIVGRDGGATASLADACIRIPMLDRTLVTPHTEGLQSVVLHLLVSHPQLQETAATWETRAKTIITDQ
jgi:D-sedoheptulose 7-phosphate isomerase